MIEERIFMGLVIAVGIITAVCYVYFMSGGRL